MVNYADDILLSAQSSEELWKMADSVFARLKEFGLKLNFDKVNWVSREIDFLGHAISSKGVSLELYLRKKAAAVGEVKIINDLEKVIGFLTYYSHAILDASSVLAPLHD